MPTPSLITRIQTDPAYRAVIRLVGYLGIGYPISREDPDRLYWDFGKKRVQAATDQLIDYDTEAKIARLKPGVAGYLSHCSARQRSGTIREASREWHQEG